ncbi:helix-turn-helix transcriptional regulator [Deinococcus sp. KSM4-11]|uniref:helix-turn-helix transcriptional regulator n=1 Tax=Deinococcus sp. KSM4-11 TaxID=2568654 RepID=UPI0010A4FFF6|nr:helix-turn-helix transcriptional regulator [Deinococcus sp. KSM4-11]THF87165.1 helix-turn-helix transcriptional regulator [Deinococcus sp. KSM4-11]
MTRPDSPSSWQRLDDPQAARVLADAYTRQFFEPFIWRERRVSEVAREVGVTTNAMLYRVRQFLRLGLLEVTRTEARAGRAVRHYRSTSRGYFVPFSATDAASVQALYEASLDNTRRSVLAELTRAWSDLAEDPRWFGLYTSGDADGLHSHVLLPFPPVLAAPGERVSLMAPLLADGQPAIWDNTTSLRLSPSDAKALQRDLHDLHQRYRARVTASGRDHLVRLTLAPLRTD